jgi:hypothetical protein
MPTDKDRSWASLYESAMLEFDPQRLRERISLAHNAIKQRLAQLDPSHDNHGEKCDLANASRNLESLRFCISKAPKVHAASLWNESSIQVSFQRLESQVRIEVYLGR